MLKLNEMFSNRYAVPSVTTKKACGPPLGKFRFVIVPLPAALDQLTVTSTFPPAGSIGRTVNHTSVSQKESSGMSPVPV